MNKRFLRIKDKSLTTIKNNLFIIAFAIITLVSLIIRLKGISIVTDDFIYFLSKWYNELKKLGGLNALKYSIGDYNIPYMTILAIFTYIPVNPLILIKTTSIVFDYVCAFTTMCIIFLVFKNNEKKYWYALLLYGMVILLPTVVLNSAYWGQADSIYCAFILISILFLMKEKYIKSLIFLGIAFSFKIQTVFIFPMYFLYYISKRKFPIYYFGIIPLVNLVMCMPAIILGRNILECMTIYFNQMQEYKYYMSMNLSNMYSIVLKANELNIVWCLNTEIGYIGIMIAMVIFAIMAAWVLGNKMNFDSKKIIEFGLWSVMICTFFLPHMHDRYLFLGDILSVIYFAFNKNKYYIPIGISLISISGYITYFYGIIIIPTRLMGILFLTLIIMITKDLVKEYYLDKKEVKNVEE